MKRLGIAALLACAFPFAAGANDTMATLGAGGLVFIQTEDVKMLSEELYVSPDEIRVTYEFRNDGEKDAVALVAFPLPDITGSPDFMVSIPTDYPENIFGFETKVDGEPVSADLLQYVFAHNIEHTDYLREMGLPLAPHAEATVQAVADLPEDSKVELFRRGLIAPMVFDAGQGMEEHFYPVWTLKSTYVWEAYFPVGEIVVVEHKYKPSVGGTVAVTFMAEPYEDYDPLADAQRKYCVDDALYRAVEKTLTNPEERWSAPYFERWIQYVWSTGANWSGPIGEFTLIVDKGDPKNFVSFCWDGEVTKTGPTTFEARATNFYPPWDRELEIMILDYNEPVD